MLNHIGSLSYRIQSSPLLLIQKTFPKKDRKYRAPRIKKIWHRSTNRQGNIRLWSRVKKGRDCKLSRRFNLTIKLGEILKLINLTTPELSAISKVTFKT